MKLYALARARRVDGTGHLASPSTPKASRLVARIRTRGHESSSVSTSPAVVPTRCSQLSTTRSNCLSPKTSARVSAMWLSGTLGHPQGLRNSLRHQRLLGEGSKLHKPHPVRVGLDEAAGYLQGQARLSRAACSGEGQQPRHGQLTLHLEHILLATHEAAPRRGQVVTGGDPRLVRSTGAQVT